MRAYLGIDLHRRRSLVVCLDEGGDRLWWRRIDNSPLALAKVIAAAGPDAEVVIEATWGWYWAADVITAAGGRVHLAHPLGVKGFDNRRVKNDLKDATLLADLLRMGSLPEAWVAPGSVRELRELVRYRHKLSQLRTGLKGQIHAVLGKEGMLPELRELWGPAGSAYFDELRLGEAYQIRLDSLRDLIGIYEAEVAELDAWIHSRLHGDTGYEAIQRLRGVGRVHAAALCAEIGDVSRFRTPQRLCSWAGLTPRHRESDVKVQRGGITKQGSTLVRWTAIEAISRYRTVLVRDLYRRVAERRGVNVARAAAARKLLTFVYYGLRDGEIRCLEEAA